MMIFLLQFFNQSGTSELFSLCVIRITTYMQIPMYIHLDATTYVLLLNNSVYNSAGYYVPTASIVLLHTATKYHLHTGIPL
jgi:hypothetical protein